MKGLSAWSEHGCIVGYRAVVDRKKVDLSLVVFCNISLEKHDSSFIEKFGKDIQKLPEVVECYHIGGMFDYLLKVVVKDMDVYQEFVSKKLAALENIGRVQSSFVMDEVKNSRGLPIC